MENYLQSSLGPVDPNPEFIKKLRLRLMEKPAISLEKRSLQEIFVLLGAGLFLGVILAWLFRLIRRGL